MKTSRIMVGTAFEEPHQFVIQRTISEGGMGIVYQAVLLGPEGFEKTVAIKMVKEELAERRDFTELFVGEAKLVADLVHQNIVQIYKLGRTANTFYIAMEYVHGVSLREFINRHVELGVHVPVELGAFIVSRICRGLAYAHDKRSRDGSPLGVVHRDISPNNVMISSEGEVKITDFGIAKAAGLLKDEEGSILMGKAAYMSPEQAQYQKTDRRSDLFSLGLVAIELLTNEMVFRWDHDGGQILRKVVEQEIDPPHLLNPEIPDALETILMKSLQRDLRARYQDAGRMAYDLEHFLYGKGYGPTILSLERHMRLLFPKVYERGSTGRASTEEPSPGRVGPTAVTSAPSR